MLQALIDGEHVHTLAEMAKARMRPKIPQLVQALTGNLGKHHAFLCRIHLERINQLSVAILELSARTEEEIRPFAHQLERLATIPGSAEPSPRSSSPRPATTWRGLPPPGISRPGQGPAPATTKLGRMIEHTGTNDATLRAAQEQMRHPESGLQWLITTQQPLDAPESRHALNCHLQPSHHAQRGPSLVTLAILSSASTPTPNTPHSYHPSVLVLGSVGPWLRQMASRG